MTEMFMIRIAMMVLESMMLGYVILAIAKAENLNKNKWVLGFYGSELLLLSAIVLQAWECYKMYVLNRCYFL